MKNRLHRYDTNRLKKLSNTEAGLKKSVACKKACITFCLNIFFEDILQN